MMLVMVTAWDWQDDDRTSPWIWPHDISTEPCEGRIVGWIITPAPRPEHVTITPAVLNNGQIAPPVHIPSGCVREIRHLDIGPPVIPAEPAYAPI